MENISHDVKECRLEKGDVQDWRKWDGSEPRPGILVGRERGRGEICSGRGRWTKVNARIIAWALAQLNQRHSFSKIRMQRVTRNDSESVRHSFMIISTAGTEAKYIKQDCSSIIYIIHMYICIEGTHKYLTISVLQACCAVTTEYGIPSNFVRKSTALLKIKI